MEIKGKVHLLFEQSGTFKNEFKKLGYEAFDYDIQNNFGETDYQIDIFNEIEKAYKGGQESIFDKMTKDDLIMAFFPCIYFEAMQANYYSMRANNLYSLPKEKQYEVVLDRAEKRNLFYMTIYRMYATCDLRGLRLIIENPATKPHFLFHTSNFIPPTFIDVNRMLRGDYFNKPTAYWFVNCKPTYGMSYQMDKEKKTIMKSKGASKAGLCSEERSLISPDYARNFICDFILGKEQQHTLRRLF